MEVSDEIAEAFLLDKRAEAARERKMYRYKAFYSLDCNDGIENAAIGWAQPSPEDCLMEKEAQAEYAELLRRLYEAISSLPPTQARRVHARYMLGMKVKDIAAMEGITPSQAGKSIHAAPVSYTHLYLRTYRLQVAQKLLLETELSVTEIANKIGYENPNKFTSAFKETYGSSPTEFRKSVRLDRNESVWSGEEI